MSEALRLPAVVAAAILFFLIKSRWNYLRLPKLPELGADLGRKVTVVIPARNHEATIARAVKSFPGLRVVVVNDRSTDGTAEAARKAGADVIDTPPPPSGWLSRPHVCWTGAQACPTPWVLFVDADTWYARPFAASLLGYAEQEQLDVATLFLAQKRHSITENILLPYAFGLYFCGVNAGSVNRVGSGQILANGQCMLVRREAYLGIGGHSAVPDSAIEDVDFAAVAKANRLRLRVLRAEHLGSAMTGNGFPAISRAFAKDSFRFLIASPLGGAQVMLASIALLFYVPSMMYLAVEQQWVVLAAFAFLPSLSFLPWYGGAWAFTAPAAIYLFHFFALKGLFSTLFRRNIQ